MERNRVINKPWSRSNVIDSTYFYSLFLFQVHVEHPSMTKYTFYIILMYTVK